MHCKNYLLLLLLFVVAGSNAQPTQALFQVEGRVIDSLGGTGVEGVEILLPAQKRIVVTDAAGAFSFDGMRRGIFSLCLRGGSAEDTLRLYADPAHPLLPDIRIGRRPAAEPPDAAIPEVTVQTDDADESGLAASDYAAPTQAGRNPFSDGTAFNLFAFRFQPRAYHRRSQEVHINTLPVHDPASLFVPWNAWSGLADAFWNREQRYGIGAADAAFGGLAGSVNFDITAAAQRPQSRITYGLTNRSYRNRIAFSRSSGILPTGWAWSVNGAYRVARAGFVPGTFTEGASLYAAGSKVFGPAHSLHLAVCGAWSRVGRSAAVTEETVALSNDPWYNPNWGMQNGRVRNARVSSALQPFALLTHQYRPGKRLRIETSLLGQSGQSGATGLDYYNASNPRPDYYRYLPSYLEANGRDPALAAFHTRSQIDWDDLYQQNRLQWDTVHNASGVPGQVVAGNRSVYAVFRDVQELRKAVLGSNVQWKPARWLQVSAGASGIIQAEARYRELADLLGGSFYLNRNAFIESAGNESLSQYDLGVPDRPIRTGDRYGYDYSAHSRELCAWAGGQAALGRLDVHMSARLLHRRYRREGYFRNGLFPGASYGVAPPVALQGIMVTSGISYRIDGRTQALINVTGGTQPPGFDQAYISPRVRNTPNTLAVPESVQSIELGLMHRSSRLHLHLMGFATRSRGAAEIRRYYSDDPAFASFVNYLMTGVAKQYSGLELGMELQLTPLLAFRGAASLTDAFYAANPHAVYVYGDNDTAQVPQRRDVYLQNLALAFGPQTAATAGLNYRSTKYWYAGVSVAYAARSFIDVNPDRRSEAAIRGLAPGSAAYERILGQERLPPAYTLDLSAGKNWLLSKYVPKLPRNTYLYLNASMSNVLNRPFRTGGYEQLRFDYAGQDPGKFANKYFYAPGRNFLVSISVRW